MRKSLITAAASSLLLFATIAGAQTARAIISDTPIRAEADLASPIIATIRNGDPVDVVDLQGDWYRVLVPTEQGKPRVGYVLSRLIQIVSATDSPASQPITSRPRTESNLHEPQIAPTPGQITSQRDLGTERERQLTARAEALQAQLNALQTDQPARTRPSNTMPPISPEMGSKSSSSGFFVGLGLEGNAIVPTENGVSGAAESGRGVGLVLGYGFNPHWSIYGMLSGASINSSDFSGTYGLGHFDLGTRIHFLAGPHRVVPFVQAGLAGRAINEEFSIGSRKHTVAASGAGVAFGGGLNVHFIPAFAFSGGVTWMVADFSTYEVDGQNIGGDSVSATSARVHFGVIWYPRHRPSAVTQP